MKTVLVVDNNPDVLRLIDRALTGFGFIVRLATSGVEALAIYRSETVNFVLLDVQMPDMDGPQTLAALKAIDPNVVCCFMSSSNGASKLNGAAGFINKPFASLEDLRKLIEKMTADE